MKHEVELPYSTAELTPYISRETLEFHFGKHHKSYAANLNELIAGTKYEDLSLEELIHTSTGKIYNNAAQVWNHSFYWESFIANADQGRVSGLLAKQIKEQYGSVIKMKKSFTQMALANFASGWTWLVANPKGGLEIVNTDDADCVITHKVKPLLVCDVWEHAYYIDRRNDRADYLKNFWQVVNWRKVSGRYKDRTKD